MFRKANEPTTYYGRILVRADIPANLQSKFFELLPDCCEYTPPWVLDWWCVEVFEVSFDGTGRSVNWIKEMNFMNPYIFRAEIQCFDEYGHHTLVEYDETQHKLIHRETVALSDESKEVIKDALKHYLSQYPKKIATIYSTASDCGVNIN
ncbi:MAG: hypothetical protein IIT65_13810 [Lachnospiraceae bacterium]|nr:hypothetical protein [Lachnospiraceae bacterium]